MRQALIDDIFNEDTYLALLGQGFLSEATTAERRLVLLDEEIISTGMGLSKKQAEQLAAERALTELGVA